MNKKINILTGLAAAISPIVITMAVSCGKQHKIKSGVEKVTSNDQGNQNPLPPVAPVATPSLIKDISNEPIVQYTPETLMNEAKKINTPSDIFWKSGFRYESMTQVISFLEALAEEYGFNMDEALRNSDMTLLIDDSNKSKSNEELLATVKADGQIAQENIDASTDELNRLKGFEVNLATPTAEELKKIRLLAPNQTIDSPQNITDDLHLTTPDLQKYARDTVTADEHGVNGLTGTQMVMTWYDHKNPGDQIVTIAERDDFLGKASAQNYNFAPIYIVRKMTLHNVAPRYPLIEENLFKEEYAPYLKAALSSVFNKMLGFGIDSVSYVVPKRFGVIITYLLDKITTKEQDADGNEVLKLNFDDAKLLEAMEAINKTQTINWLAVKAIYKGYGEEFSTNGYDKWINSNWRTAASQAPVGSVGVSSSDWDLTAGSDAPSGLTPWMHGNDGSLFNPTLSLEDNYKLNGVTYTPVH